MDEYNEQNNFLTVSQVIKNIDNEYTNTENKDDLYNSNFIFEY
jgi:hypothetical protein